MTSILPAVAVVVTTTVLAAMPAVLLAHTEPCTFNPLCSCSTSNRDVSCIGVPFAAVPHLSLDSVYQLNLLRAGVEVLHDHSFQKTRISSLRMMQNKLSLIHPKAFHGSESTLTTIDLSFNKLYRLPQESLQKLHHLQWLSLHSNDIEEWPSLNYKPNLRSIFLGDNSISRLQNSGFSHLRNLTSLNLDHNSIVEIEPHAFPSSLQSLSLANNLLKHVPTAAIRHLGNLTWLQLGGNLFEQLPKPLKLPVKSLLKLDFSHNLLVVIPSGFMNETGATITNLHLEFNYIRTISRSAFQGLVLERLSLSNNRLTTIPDGAFEGLQETLKALDLSYNLFETFPKSLKDLKVLSHLYLRGNSLKELDQYDLQSCKYDLEVLDLSGNQLTKIPRESLQVTQRISRLSLQDNAISEVGSADFVEWGQSLTALNLANNRIRRVSSKAFQGTTKLRELRLSYNHLLSLDPDILNPVKATLEILEIGSFNSPSLKALQDFEKLKWLQMDHNNIEEISSNALDGVPWLIHCDLEGNGLKSIPLQLFRSTIHTRLNSIVLANNQIEVIESDAFNQLPLITNIVLFGNQLKVLKTRAFRDMDLLNTVILAKNNIEFIEKGAFTNLRSLSNIFLHENRLTKFSFDSFHDVGDAKNPVFLNLSNNQISQLVPVDFSRNMTSYIRVRSLDLSWNNITSIQKNFLRPVGTTLHYLFMSSNRISFISNFTFMEVPHLQVLHLSNNSIPELQAGVFQHNTMLQILHLDHNNLSSVASGAFGNLSSLRILDMSYNNLMFLPNDIFVGSKLERVNLSNNNIFHPPLRSLAHVRSTLRYLDLSHNRISSLSATELNHLHNLLSLNLSFNELTNLGENVFSKLVYLLHLDLSHNTLWRLGEEPFKPLVSLQTLLLKDVNLPAVPSLPLPSLRVLCLSYNFLYNISDQSFVHVKELRHLDLSHNYLNEVPVHVWPSVSRLTYLDISYNPIQVLSTNSFKKLEKLKELDMRGLDLKQLDTRILYNLRFLTGFKTNTYANLRSFRLHDLLSKSSCLRKVVVEVEETNLSHQLQWTFGTKLRELTITGRSLQYIIPDAFLGLQTHELILRITGTSISRLPNGLLRYLADVRYLTLDIRGNLLTSMDEEVLSPANRIKSEVLVTQHISGGVLLENNPWICSCSIVWLGNWIRRWMRETLRVQMLHFDGFLYAQNLARRTVCTRLGTSETVPIVDLDPAEFGCTTDSTNSATKTLETSLQFHNLLAASVIIACYGEIANIILVVARAAYSGVS